MISGAIGITRAYTQTSSLEDKVIILVGGFESELGDNNALTKEVKQKLEDLTDYADDDDLIIKQTEGTIRSKEQAFQVGEDENADIVIWGHYSKTERIVRPYLNIEIVNSPLEILLVRNSYSNAPIPYTPQHLTSLRIHDDFRNESSSFALLLLAMYRYVNLEIDETIEILERALRENEAFPLIPRARQEVQMFLANVHSSREEYQKSFVLFEDIIKNNPYNAEAYVDYSLALIKKSDFKAAEQKLHQSLMLLNKRESIPDFCFCRPYLLLGYVYYFLNDFDESLKNLDKAVSLEISNMTKAEVINFRGFIRLMNGKIDDALGDFYLAIDRNSSYAKAYANLGTIYQIKGDIVKAREQFLKLRHIDPIAGDINLVSILVEQNKYADAEKKLKKVMQSLEKSHALWNYLGIIYWLSEKHSRQDAIDAFKTANKLNPKEIVYLNNLGVALSRHGEFELAEKAFLDLIEIEPESIYGLSNLLEVYVSWRKKDKASALREKLYFLLNEDIEDSKPSELKCTSDHFGGFDCTYITKLWLRKIEPDKDEILSDILIEYMYKIASEYESGNIEFAKTELDKMIAMHPKHIVSFLTASKIYQKENELQLALVNINKTLNMEYSLPAIEREIYFNKGAIHFELKQFEEAAEWFEKFRTLVPYEHYAAFNVGLSKFNINRKSPANINTAIFYFSEAISLIDDDGNPVDTSKYYFFRGLAYKLRNEEGDVKRASNDFEKASFLDPNNDEAFIQLDALRVK